MGAAVSLCGHALYSNHSAYSVRMSCVSSLRELAITQEDLDARNAAGDFVFCTFDDFAGKLWQDFRSPDKAVKVTATAKNIRILNAGSVKESK